MKKTNETKKLSVSEQLKAGEISGAKVAKIMNKARKDANKLLAAQGYEVNIQVDFYKIGLIPKEEVTNG